jgi:hypothetical protein
MRFLGNQLEDGGSGRGDPEPGGPQLVDRFPVPGVRLHGN